MSVAEHNFRAFAVGLAAAAVCAAVYVVLYPGPVVVTTTVLRDALVFAILAVIADEMSVEVSDRVTLAAGNLPLLLAIMYTGRVPALAVALVLGLWGAWREESRVVVVFNAANTVISVFLATLVFEAVSGLLDVPADSLSVSLLAAGAAAAVTFEAFNLVLV